MRDPRLVPETRKRIDNCDYEAVFAGGCCFHFALHLHERIRTRAIREGHDGKGLKGLVTASAIDSHATRTVGAAVLPSGLSAREFAFQHRLGLRRCNAGWLNQSARGCVPTLATDASFTELRVPPGSSAPGWVAEVRVSGLQVLQVGDAWASEVKVESVNWPALVSTSPSGRQMIVRRSGAGWSWFGCSWPAYLLCEPAPSGQAALDQFHRDDFQTGWRRLARSGL